MANIIRVKFADGNALLTHYALVDGETAFTKDTVLYDADFEKTYNEVNSAIGSIRVPDDYLLIVDSIPNYHFKSHYNNGMFRTSLEKLPSVVYMADEWSFITGAASRDYTFVLDS